MSRDLALFRATHNDAGRLQFNGVERAEENDFLYKLLPEALRPFKEIPTRVADIPANLLELEETQLEEIIGSKVEGYTRALELLIKSHIDEELITARVTNKLYILVRHKITDTTSLGSLIERFADKYLFGCCTVISNDSVSTSYSQRVGRQVIQPLTNKVNLLRVWNFKVGVLKAFADVVNEQTGLRINESGSLGPFVKTTAQEVFPEESFRPNMTDACTANVFGRLGLLPNMNLLDLETHDRSKWTQFVKCMPVIKDIPGTQLDAESEVKGMIQKLFFGDLDKPATPPTAYIILGMSAVGKSSFKLPVTNYVQIDGDITRPAETSLEIRTNLNKELEEKFGTSPSDKNWKSWIQEKAMSENFNIVINETLSEDKSLKKVLEKIPKNYAIELHCLTATKFTRNTFKLIRNERGEDKKAFYQACRMIEMTPLQIRNNIKLTFYKPITLNIEYLTSRLESEDVNNPVKDEAGTLEQFKEHHRELCDVSPYDTSPPPPPPPPPPPQPQTESIPEGLSQKKSCPIL